MQTHDEGTGFHVESRLTSELTGSTQWTAAAPLISATIANKDGIDFTVIQRILELRPEPDSTNIALCLGVETNCKRLLLQHAFGCTFNSIERFAAPQLRAARSPFGPLVLNLEPTLSRASLENKEAETRILRFAAGHCDHIVVLADVNGGPNNDCEEIVCLRSNLETLSQGLHHGPHRKKMFFCVRDWDPLRDHAAHVQSNVVPRFLLRLLGQQVYEALQATLELVICLLANPADSAAEFQCGIAHLQRNILETRSPITRPYTPAEFTDRMRTLWHQCLLNDSRGSEAPIAVEKSHALTTENVNERSYEVEDMMGSTKSISRRAASASSGDMEATMDVVDSDRETDCTCHCNRFEDRSQFSTCQYQSPIHRRKSQQQTATLRLNNPSHDQAQHKKAGQQCQYSGSTSCGHQMMETLQQQLLTLQHQFEALRTESDRRKLQIGYLQQQIERIHSVLPLAGCL